MVYESDFYTTRRPYRTSYSVTVSLAAAPLTHRECLAPRPTLPREPDAPRTTSTLARVFPRLQVAPIT